MKIAIHVKRGKDRGCVQAYCPDLAGCSAAAETEQEALALLRRRIRSYFAEEKGRPVPPGVRRLELEV